MRVPQWYEGLLVDDAAKCRGASKILSRPVTAASKAAGLPHAAMMNPLQSPLVVFAVSFLVLWGAARVGSRLRRIVKCVREDFAIVMTATLTLVGLILGFTFSMSVNRYEQRKLYEEEEANAIGTEYVRAELLEPADRDNVRKLLREYLDQRILFYRARTRGQLRAIDAATSQLQARLWQSVKVPSLANQTAVTALVVSGMNDVLNSQGYTLASWRNRIPLEAWILMGLIVTFANLMVGLYLRPAGSAGALLMVLPAIVSVSFFLIADIDSPRDGLIHVSAQNLMEVARSICQP